jgi:gamma-glutamyltranspeptidase/glutathione hydrolase
MSPTGSGADGSSARGERWGVATPHPLAADAAAAAFASGGNAVDAALHAAVTIAVVSPHRCGVGGDLFALVQNPDGKLVAIDSSGRAPAAADPETLRAAHGTTMPDSGPETITVPGAIRGWDALHRQGAALPWRDAFAAAVDAAEGFAVSRDLAGSLARGADRLRSDPGLAEVFFGNGALSEGDRLGQPALARTLRTLADGGPDAFYAGDLGARYADGLGALGASISAGDLAAHTADLLPALRGRYRDLDVSVTPPGSQGFVLLEALAALERLGIDPDPTGTDAATLARILMAASADRDRHLADPDAMRIHVSALLDDGHIAALCDVVRGRLQAHASDPTGSGPEAGGDRPGDTIALVAADADGWGVSLIESLFSAWGAGCLEPATGIIPHDRGACFTLEPGHPNELAPGKRPAHTLMPVAVHRAGSLVGLAGTRGGHGQPQIDLMTLVRAFDLGLDPGDAVAAPRWLVGGMSPLRGDDPWIEAEGAVPQAVRASFVAEGFRVRTLDDVDAGVGHAMLLRVDEGTFVAGSDPRADGGARAS